MIRYSSHSGEWANISKRNRIDLLVVGGGLFGVALARVAAFNGLSALYISDNDFQLESDSTYFSFLKASQDSLTRLKVNELMELQKEWQGMVPHLVHKSSETIPSLGERFWGRGSLAKVLGRPTLNEPAWRLTWDYGSVFWETFQSARSEGAVCLNWVNWRPLYQDHDSWRVQLLDCFSSLSEAVSERSATHELSVGVVVECRVSREGEPLIREVFRGAKEELGYLLSPSSELEKGGIGSYQVAELPGGRVLFHSLTRDRGALSSGVELWCSEELGGIRWARELELRREFRKLSLEVRDPLFAFRDAETVLREVFEWGGVSLKRFASLIGRRLPGSGGLALDGDDDRSSCEVLNWASLRFGGVVGKFEELEGGCLRRGEFLRGELWWAQQVYLARTLKGLFERLGVNRGRVLTFPAVDDWVGIYREELSLEILSSESLSEALEWCKKIRS